MNLQQLEYIVAVDQCRHFVTAAEQCFVTQATLSMMIKKLEMELDTVIFDRSRQPVTPTPVGEKIIAQARLILSHVERLKALVDEERNCLQGEFKLGIIPTLAPYLLPLFLQDFLKKYPQIKLRISELTTEEIVKRIHQHHLDAGLLATPIEDHSLKELPLFYEQFVVYHARPDKKNYKKYVLASDIDVNRLWLLEEGHCLRTQIINLCELKDKSSALHQLDFETGSLEMLKKIVESTQGITILPELAVRYLSPQQKKWIRYFKPPAPVREISLVTHPHYARTQTLEALKNHILSHIPEHMKTRKQKAIIPATPVVP
ncbi:LysR family hydrogen peroxide-inducible transcriptional activator [Thermoflavifilum aggregans]|uniref:LysR family hydrogen peroxide-inducible transcriptional activator n=1 Tax=Thermoflavifilum aggregans TaxID=454188 RepID=A0A2M9CY12_9BACT|nr:hydrogen peroxide-inducible genes activator [Thermoflavifilum aggregans]PJJ76790.1 LysR family hydrogen peroxide-inducible transcriptional activator [Thermoflavifilum aggregans]